MSPIEFVRLLTDRATDAETGTRRMVMLEFKRLPKRLQNVTLIDVRVFIPSVPGNTPISFNATIHLQDDGADRGAPATPVVDTSAPQASPHHVDISRNARRVLARSLQAWQLGCHVRANDVPRWAV